MHDALPASIRRWFGQIVRSDRVAEFVRRAFHTAMAGRPGPVVLVLPDDMQSQIAPRTGARPYTRVAAHPGPAALGALGEMLARARRPLVVLGGSGWTEAACADLSSFIDAWDLPVACSFRRQDLFDNRDRHYVGDLSPGMNPALAQRVR